MKIGIVTYHRAYNYGAFLQAYALKKFLENEKHDVSFVDYQSSEHNAEYKLINPQIFKKCNYKGKAYLILMALMALTRTFLRQNKMKRLQKKFLGVEGLAAENITLLEDKSYDVAIYGSDQIWRKSKANPGGGFDPVYWGEGVRAAKKIAYAPSMGVIDINQSDHNFIKSHLRLFSNLSCREDDLKKVLEQDTDKKILQVLDPVFLLPPKDWNDLILSRKSLKRRNYVLIYNLMHSEAVLRLAKKIASEESLEIIEITGSVAPMTFRHDVKQTEDAIDFITMIKNATYVVASSFHAIAFSIIFKTNFYAVGLNKNSGRVSSLLKLAGLEERLVNDNFDDSIQSIDFSKVDLNSEIQKSQKYLLHSLAK